LAGGEERVEGRKERHKFAMILSHVVIVGSKFCLPSLLPHPQQAALSVNAYLDQQEQAPSIEKKSDSHMTCMS
jgi:hypothetical protein